MTNQLSAILDPDPIAEQLIIKQLGLNAYQDVWQAMKSFAQQKQAKVDELWVLEHEPVYTRGLRCKENPLEQAQHIPLVSVDRGGLMTYHGPGQVIFYGLINIKRKQLNIKQVVSNYEQTVINLLNGYGLDAQRIEGAPGVYVEQQKIASIGIRVRNNVTYHGLSVNFDMDLTPFNWINTCGFEHLQVIQLSDFVENFKFNTARAELVKQFVEVFEYSDITQLDPTFL